MSNAQPANGAVYPPRTRHDLSYGPHERHVYDFTPAASESPSPVIVWFHGGGFVRGDKEIGYRKGGCMIRSALRLGVSFAGANYRYATDATLPEIMRDGARLIQHMRWNARDLAIDPNRIAAFGGSAGSGIALFLAFHPDLADPENADPILRESSRITCAGSFAGQALYDPRYLIELLGEPPPATAPAANGSATVDGTAPAPAPAPAALAADIELGRLFWGASWDPSTRTPEIESAIRDVGPLSLIGVDAPPVFLFNPFPPEPPLDWASWVHHPSQQRAILSRCNEVGVECRMRLASDYMNNGIGIQDGPWLDWLDFCLAHFGMPRRNG